ncbi:acyl-CoA thioesterase [Chitinophaga sp. 22620]|uniref:acyl-CoA thioesterase n=1 Tax=Chitinophaga sp. 22620 TaxID=3453952 RepID=UPI003F85FF94
MTVKEPSSLYTVRFNDCDPFGHLNNSSYINYFMNAREDHLAESYDLHLKDYAAKGLGWVVTQHQISYIKPAFVAEKVHIHSRVLEFSNHHILVEMWMTDEQKKKVKSFLWSRFAHIDLKTGKRAEHDEALLKLLDEIRVEHNGVDTFDQRVGAVLQSF